MDRRKVEFETVRLVGNGKWAIVVAEISIHGGGGFGEPCGFQIKRKLGESKEKFKMMK